MADFDGFQDTVRNLQRFLLRRIDLTIFSFVLDWPVLKNRNGSIASTGGKLGRDYLSRFNLFNIDLRDFVDTKCLIERESVSLQNLRASIAKRARAGQLGLRVSYDIAIFLFQLEHIW